MVRFILYLIHVLQELEDYQVVNQTYKIFHIRSDYSKLVRKAFIPEDNMYSYEF